jgi:hypothetical protein
MAEIRLRFYGRFVFAQQEQPETPPQVHILAANMAHNSDVGASKHRLVITAPREKTAFDGRRPPDLMLMASNVPTNQGITHAEHAVWELEGYNLSIDGDGFNWTDNHRGLIDFATLNDKKNRVSPRIRDEKNAPMVTSIIHLTRGFGACLFGEVVDFVEFGAPDRPPTPGLKLADAVEVRIDVPSDDAKYVEFRLSSRKSASGDETIRVMADDAATTFVSISNLCSGVRQGNVDKEFAGLYEVLEQPRPLRERLVPKPRPNLNNRNDCYKSAYAIWP